MKVDNHIQFGMGWVWLNTFAGSGRALGEDISWGMGLSGLVLEMRKAVSITSVSFLQDLRRC